MSSGPYDIVLLPHEEIAAKAIRTSQELAALGTEFTLGREQYLPHVSLYMTQLKSEDLREVGERLAEIASKTRAPNLQADTYLQGRGYIDANYSRTPEIEALQAAVIEAINPLRAGMRAEVRTYLQTADGLKRHNLEQYGYKSVGELFRPHLTLTRFTDLRPISVEDLLVPSIFSGTFATLALCEMGDHGTCLRKIQEFALQ